VLVAFEIEEADIVGEMGGGFLISMNGLPTNTLGFTGSCVEAMACWTANQI